MQRWLQNFTNHIDLDFMPFILGGILTLTVALVTVGYHAVRIAMANPVD
jgi:putative ABC transport system permease protein